MTDSPTSPIAFLSGDQYTSGGAYSKKGVIGEYAHRWTLAAIWMWVDQLPGMTDTPR